MESETSEGRRGRRERVVAVQGWNTASAVLLFLGRCCRTASVSHSSPEWRGSGRHSTQCVDVTLKKFELEEQSKGREAGKNLASGGVGFIYATWKGGE